MAYIEMQPVRDLLYLIKCALHEQTPDHVRVASMDMDALLRLGRAHKISAMIAMSLEMLVYKSETDASPELPENLAAYWNRWKQLRDMSVRREILFDAEREKHLRFFEEHGIWYIPLKGILVKSFYPRFGMREMADNDILYDREYQQLLCDHMLEEGYEAKSVGRGVHDTYHKEPVFNFEFHTALFSDGLNDGSLAVFFSEIKNRAIKDETNQYGYHMAAEDLYIYLSAHAFKHYSNSGTGLRTIADNYMIRRACGDSIDRESADRKMEQIGILEFDRTLCALSTHLLSPAADGREAELSPAEQEMLEYMAGSGVYGTLQNRVQNRLHGMQEAGQPLSAGTKRRYIVQRIFPGAAQIRASYPFARKYPVLIPVISVYRIGRAVLNKRGNIKRELDVLRKAE